jgi:probable phosphoglycerate mutase
VQSQDLRVYILRHRQTAWSLSGQHTGRTDIPLTETGEAEASPLRRARRTCELAGLGHTVDVAADLGEWNYGKYEGLKSGRPGQHPGGRRTRPADDHLHRRDPKPTQ